LTWRRRLSEAELKLKQLGQYTLEEKIGEGGMGVVYRARHALLRRDTAVKLLLPDRADPASIARFEKEVRLTCQLTHPNTIQVYDYGHTPDGIFYYAMEFLRGLNLHDLIARYGPQPEGRVIHILAQVCDSLAEAHALGLIHRDIKPGNILFNANNTPKVVDFGLSLTFETTDHFNGEIWGTPYYVAPEKLERLTEDFRSDLYSLGATLFHAISGRPPYEGEDPNDVAMKHLSGSVISLKAFVPDISDQTSYAVSKAMARQPNDRYESYAEFIEQLEDAKRRITDPEFHEKRQQDVVIISNPAAGKYRLWVVVGLIAAVIILAVLFFFKGSSLLHQKETVSPELGNYAPKPSGK
jgi:eukaryotic-like serine/threonine-protein kinase